MDYDKAEALYNESLDIKRSILAHKDDNIVSLKYATTLNNLAQIISRKGDYKKAISYLKEALVTRRLILGSDHQLVAESLANLGNVYNHLGDFSNARSNLEEALQIYSKSELGKKRYVAQILADLAFIDLLNDKYFQRENRYKQAIENIRTNLGENHPDLCNISKSLAILYLSSDRFNEAINLLKTVISIEDFLISQILGMSSESQRLIFLEEIDETLQLFVLVVSNQFSGCSSEIKSAYSSEDPPQVSPQLIKETRLSTKNKGF